MATDKKVYPTFEVAGVIFEAKVTGRAQDILEEQDISVTTVFADLQEGKSRKLRTFIKEVCRAQKPSFDVDLVGDLDSGEQMDIIMLLTDNFFEVQIKAGKDAVKLQDKAAPYLVGHDGGKSEEVVEVQPNRSTRRAATKK